MDESQGRRVMDADEMRRSLVRIAHEIIEKNKGADRLVIRGKPRIAVVGGLLGALFGRIKYRREGP